MRSPSIDRSGLALGIKEFFFLFYVAAASGALATLFGGEAGEGGLFVAFWGGLYLATGCALFFSKKSIFSKNEVGLYFLIALLLASFSWSELPKSTLSYSVSISANCIFAAYCSRVFRLSAFLDLLRVALNCMVFLGIALALAGVDFAFYFDPLSRSNVLGTPLVKGLFSHKIYAGFYSAIAFVLNAALTSGWRRALYCFVCLLEVLLSGSSLGLVALAGGVSVFVGLKSLSNDTTRRNLLVPIFIFILLVVLGGLAALEEVLGLLGRDLSLTGRTDLWAWALEFWGSKPVLGWGYAGIFGDSVDAPARVINDDSYYQAPHFHSGYLQVLAELGLVGFLIYMHMLVSAIFCSVRIYWSEKSIVYAVAASVLIMVAFVGTAMNIFLRYNELSSILVVFLYLSARRLSKRFSSRIR